MAGSPSFKVYNRNKEYIAACKYAEDAAAVVALYGDGATIKYQHSWLVWTEGSEIAEAATSYDFVAQTIWNRIEERRAAIRIKREKAEAAWKARYTGVMISVPEEG